MKNKKIIMLIILVLNLSIILTGCSNTNKEKSDESVKKSNSNTVKFKYVTSNNANTVALDEDGNVWSMYNAKEPEKVNIDAKIVSVEAGQHFTVALDKDGNVWTWGKNESGQLGDGTTTENQIPQKVLNNVSMISVGYNVVLAITKNNELYSWGYGKMHYLPKDNASDTNNYLSPTKYDSNIEFVYARSGKGGGGVLLDKDNNRYVWGLSTSVLGVLPSQVGLQSEAIFYIVKKVSDDEIKFKEIFLYSNEIFAIDENGNLYGAGNKNAVIGISHENNVVSEFTKIKDDTKFSFVCVKDKYALALDKNGNIWAWGEENDITSKSSIEPFKLTNDKKYISIAFNNFIEKLAYAVDEDGNLYVWGEGKSKTPTLLEVKK